MQFRIIALSSVALLSLSILSTPVTAAPFFLPGIDAVQPNAVLATPSKHSITTEMDIRSLDDEAKQDPSSKRYLMNAPKSDKYKYRIGSSGKPTKRGEDDDGDLAKRFGIAAPKSEDIQIARPFGKRDGEPSGRDAQPEKRYRNNVPTTKKYRLKPTENGHGGPNKRSDERS